MSFFVATTISGHEKKVKNKLYSSELIHNIRGIYLLNEYHCFFENKTKEIVNVLDMNDYELVNYIKLLQSKEYIECIHQLVTEKSLTSSQQIQLNNEVTRLINEIEMMEPKKQLHLLKGYILIDCVEEYSELPSYLYNEIKTIDGVINIPSKLPIPQHEVQRFFRNSEILKIQVEDFYSTKQDLKGILQEVQGLIQI